MLPSCASTTASRGLTFVQGHRHAAEYAIQGTLFQLSKQHWLVQTSDLLLHSNNHRTNRTALELYLTLYPHASKSIHVSNSNSGKRCGALEAIAEQHWRWRCYAWVLFLHPDVYLLPGSLASLGAAAQASPSTAFFVVPLNMRAHPDDSWNRGHDDLWNTDLHMFRPPLIMASDDYGTIFDSMCINASSLPAGTKPLNASLERSFHDAITSRRAFSWCELPAKKAFTKIDALGVWHSHLAEFSVSFARAACSKLVFEALIAVLNATMAPRDLKPLFAKQGSMAPYGEQRAMLERSLNLSARFEEEALDGARTVVDAAASRHSRCIRSSSPLPPLPPLPLSPTPSPPRSSAWSGRRCQAGAQCKQLVNATWFSSQDDAVCSADEDGRSCAWHATGEFAPVALDVPPTSVQLPLAQHCHRGDEAGEWRQRDKDVVAWRPTDAEAARAYQPPLSVGSTAQHLVRALAGRRLVFVGDSMVRQIFTRLVCAVRELPVCIEPYSEFDMQLYQYRVAGGLAGGPPTDSYVYGVNAHVAKDGSIGSGTSRSRGYAMGGHATLFNHTRDDVLRAGGFEVIFVLARLRVVSALGSVVTALRPSVVVGGYFYWKPECRNAAEHADEVCANCNRSTDNHKMCTHLQWEHPQQMDEGFESLIAAVAASADSAQSPRPLEQVVWLTCPPRPLDTEIPWHRVVETADYYPRRNAHMRAWMANASEAARRRALPTRFAVLDYASMAAAQTSLRQGASAAERQVLARNKMDGTHFQCAWLQPPPTQIRGGFKQPAQLDDSKAHDVRRVCGDTFNLAVLHRLVAILGCSST